MRYLVCQAFLFILPLTEKGKESVNNLFFVELHNFCFCHGFTS